DQHREVAVARKVELARQSDREIVAQQWVGIDKALQRGDQGCLVPPLVGDVGGPDRLVRDGDAGELGVEGLQFGDVVLQALRNFWRGERPGFYHLDVAERKLAEADGALRKSAAARGVDVGR